ncbi:MAG: SGNH/GDSL hydrolase family protein [Chamaesiphon sp.]
MIPTATKAASLSTGKIDQLYVFGDSLVDDGNTFNATLKATGVGYPPPPYFGGRFSNGPVWVEDLAPLLGLTFNPNTDFAFAGATTSSNNIISSALPGLQQQIDSFTAQIKAANQVADPNALYILWAGANDYLFAGVTDPTVPVNNLTQDVISLANVGAKNIMVANLPDLGQFPGTRNSPQSSPLTVLSNAHNSILASSLNSLSKNLDPSVNILPFDISSLLSRAIANPGGLGFTNVTDPCLSQSGAVCANPDQYLFWDGFHPTDAGHKQVAAAALAAVPEPSSGLGILVFGALGAASVLKQKPKKTFWGRVTESVTRGKF